MDHPGTDEPEARIHYKTLRRTVNLINLTLPTEQLKKREKNFYTLTVGVINSIIGFKIQ